MTRSHLALALFAVGSALAAPRAVVAQDTTGVQIQIAVGRDVVDRMPVDTAAVFPADVGRLACWTRVSGAAGTTIQHVWIHGDDEFPVTMEIGGSPWRTWSTKVIPPEWTGEWRVEVRDSAGTVLASTSFTVGQ